MPLLVLTSFEIHNPNNFTHTDKLINIKITNKNKKLQLCNFVQQQNSIWHCNCMLQFKIICSLFDTWIIVKSQRWGWLSRCYSYSERFPGTYWNAGWAHSTQRTTSGKEKNKGFVMVIISNTCLTVLSQMLSFVSSAGILSPWPPDWAVSFLFYNL